VGRWLVGAAVPSGPAGLPWGTFAANVTGALLLGALTVWVLEVRAQPGRYLRPFLGVGVLGGFTTFSAYTAEARALLLDGRIAVAGLYLAATALVAVAAAGAGATLARRATARRGGRGG
jgi:fluoride exporter